MKKTIFYFSTLLLYISLTSSDISNFCIGMPDGYYVYPNDCAKFINCHGGVTSEGICPEGLLLTLY